MPVLVAVTPVGAVGILDSVEVPFEQIAFTNDPAKAVAALLSKYGVHRVLFPALQMAGLTDFELGKVMTFCDQLQVDQYRERLSAGLARLAADVGAAPPVTVRIAADEYGPDDDDDDDDPDKTDVFTGIKLVEMDDAE